MSSSKAQCWCLWRAHNLFGKEKFDIVSTINQNYTTGLLIHRSISPSCHLSSHCRFKDDQKCYLLLKVLKSQGRFLVKVRGLDTCSLNWVCCCSSVEDVNWPLKLGLWSCQQPDQDQDSFSSCGKWLQRPVCARSLMSQELERKRIEEGLAQRHRT